MENGEWESAGVCTCSRGDSGIMESFLPLLNVRFDLLVECACGQGLTVLPHSTPQQ